MGGQVNTRLNLAHWGSWGTVLFIFEFAIAYYFHIAYFQTTLKPFLAGRSVDDFMVVAKGLAVLKNLVADRNGLPKQVSIFIDSGLLIQLQLFS